MVPAPAAVDDVALDAAATAAAAAAGRDPEPDRVKNAVDYDHHATEAAVARVNAASVADQTDVCDRDRSYCYSSFVSISIVIFLTPNYIQSMNFL